MLVVELPPEPWTGTAQQNGESGATDSPVPEIEQYRILWRNGNGRERELWVSGSRDEVIIGIPKRRELAILVYAVYRDGRFATRPAAGVYPHEVGEDGRLETQWQDGFAGLVLHRVSFRLPSVNGGRLIEEARARSERSPWDFDLERVVAKLAGGEFSAIYLRPRELFDLAVDLPPGRYLPADTLLEPFEVSDGGAEPILPELPSGHHRFLHAADGAVLSVFVDEEGEPRLFAR